MMADSGIGPGFALGENWKGMTQDVPTQFFESTRILYAATTAVHSVYLGYRENRNKHSLDFDSDYRWDPNTIAGAPSPQKDGSAGADASADASVDASAATDEESISFFIEEVHAVNNLMRAALMQGYIKPEFLSMDSTREIDAGGYRRKYRSLYNLIHWGMKLYDKYRSKYNLTYGSWQNLTKAGQEYVGHLSNELSEHPKSKAELGKPMTDSGRKRKRAPGQWNRIDHWRHDHLQRKPIAKVRVTRDGRNAYVPYYGSNPEMEQRPLTPINISWRKDTARKVYHAQGDNISKMKFNPGAVVAKDKAGRKPNPEKKGKGLVFRKKKE